MTPWSPSASPARSSMRTARSAPVPRVQDDGRPRTVRCLDLGKPPVAHGQSRSRTRRAANQRSTRLAAMPLAVDRYELGPLQTNCYVVRSERGAAECAVDRPRRRRGGPSPRARAARHVVRRDPRHARPLRPPRRRRRPRRGNRRRGLDAGGRARAARALSGVRARRRAGTAARARAPGERRRDDRGRGHLVRVPRGARPLAGARRLPRRGRALQRRPPLRRLGRPRRPAGRRLGHAARLGADARRAAPARDGRPSGPRPRDDARRRARAQPVPRRARAEAGSAGGKPPTPGRKTAPPRRR